MNYRLSQKLREPVVGAPWVLYGGVATWLVVSCFGMLCLTAYANHSEPTIRIPSTWQGETGIKRASSQKQILVFIHPHCACSQATLRQLMAFCSAGQPPLRISFQFFCPEGQSELWAETSLWKSALRFPNAECQVDWGGVEARLHGVKTSGHIMLFDELDRLQFSGGVTISRGHDGTSIAMEALQDCVRGKKVPECEFPVFGCALFGSSEPGNGGVRQ